MNYSNFESFNARNLTPEEVAWTFISNADYNNLWRNDHTVLLGPRGSGKTTMLKMLTVQALHTWDDPRAQALRKSRPFTAIYVPTDMHWHHQLKHGEERLRFSPDLKHAVSQCAVTTSILLAVIRTFQDRLKYEAPDESKKESVVSRQLIQSWLLGNVVPTFEMIAIALKARIVEIRSHINFYSLHTATNVDVSQLPKYYHLDYFSAMDFACSVFDSTFQLPQSNKWALCLDELELAPVWLQSLALSQVRSSDQGYLIKVSTSPLPTVSGDTGAYPKQDYKLITIWNHSDRDKDSHTFAEQLATSVLSRRFGKGTTPSSILGGSPLMSTDESEPTKYERGSTEWKLFQDTAKWDVSFRKLLEANDIDANDPYTEDISVRDSFLRKAKPIATFRSVFLKRSSEGTLWFRSRKVTGVYCGTDAVFRVSDGNPRRLIGIINDLAAKVKLGPTGDVLPLSQNEQDDVLNKASSQFLGYVNALPGGSATLGQDRLDLATILKAIATYFRQSMLGNEFPLDPKGSFVIDSKLNSQLVELIRLGVYHGAIVHVDPLPDKIETSVIGKRFRLSYMLSPVTRLPLMLYGQISLTTILKSSGRIRVRKLVGSLEQTQLPI